MKAAQKRRVGGKEDLTVSEQTKESLVWTDQDDIKKLALQGIIASRL
jgi:hypothetical protein